MLTTFTSEELIAGVHLSDSDLFGLCNVECGDGYLWEVTRPRSRYDATAMHPDELRRLQKQEKAKRAEQLATLVAAMGDNEHDTLTDLLDSPEWVGKDIPEVE